MIRYGCVIFHIEYRGAPEDGARRRRLEDAAAPPLSLRVKGAFRSQGTSPVAVPGVFKPVAAGRSRTFPPLSQHHIPGRSSAARAASRWTLAPSAAARRPQVWGDFSLTHRVSATDGSNSLTRTLVYIPGVWLLGDGRRKSRTHGYGSSARSLWLLVHFLNPPPRCCFTHGERVDLTAAAAAARAPEHRSTGAQARGMTDLGGVLTSEKRLH